MIGGDGAGVQISIRRIQDGPLMGGIGTVAQRPEYRFEMRVLGTGRYRIDASFESGKKSFGASQIVDLDSSSPEIQLALTPAADIQGILRFEGKASDPQNRPAAPAAGITRVQLFRPGTQEGSISAQVRPDGRFTPEQVLPGEWQLAVNALPGFLKSAHLGDKDILLTTFEFSGNGDAPLNIVVSARTATLGAEVDAGSPASRRAGIRLARVGQYHYLTRFYYFTAADDEGKFKLAGIAPGKHKLFAFEKLAATNLGGTRKSVQVSQGDTTAKITVELVPGAIVTGRVVDEDGDPLGDCRTQPRGAKSFNQFVPAIAVTGSDGTYRLVNVPPGKYILTAQCSTPVFQPRPLSEGPDLPPTAAYPIQFYAGADDLKSAEIVELAAATEKSGVDFQLRPVPATRIHGTIAAADADARGRDDLMVQLLPLDRKSYSSVTPSDRVNPTTGTFEIRQVFPGSYRLVVVSFNNLRYGNRMRQDSTDLVGGMVRVDVSDKPVKISLPLHHAVDIQGSIEIEGKADTTNQIAPEQISVQLTFEYQVGPYPAAARVSDDRSFIIKSILPGEWRISLAPPSVFVKSAWYGNDDVTHRALEWKPGSATPLRIVVSSNTATIRGTAPASQSIFAIPTATGDPAQTRSGQTDSNGQFTIKDLAPGSYRVVGAEAGTSPPDEGGQEATIREGETLSIDVKPENKP